MTSCRLGELNDTTFDDMSPTFDDMSSNVSNEVIVFLSSNIPGRQIGQKADLVVLGQSLGIAVVLYVCITPAS